MKKQGNNSDQDEKIYESLQIISIGENVCGVTIDTIEGLSYIKKSFWIDGDEVNITRCFKVNLGDYEILTIIYNEIGKLEVNYEVLCVMSKQLKYDTWHHIGVVMNDFLTLYIDGTSELRCKRKVIILEGNSEVLAGYEGSHRDGYSFGDIMIVNSNIETLVSDIVKREIGVTLHR
ncbi:hypothetical protein EIN_424200 [Entamoeba invadens IP1]|uniref:Uncharacterized protein n=1 Tax=Entamoeba invadens IP1 TaxID=370355 RepID=A0A0A1U5S2_ENTIV|nr:hypothetical protein EIN_424200 [Entamoeba invadens IP1]ELP89738.1 hypothetical protein EIN_424200 [Entamoeba invadens IP1]|eukprot:XP_004256509.1 hypothetical protein EIN_424200 [Entamoeba invadens IP1]